MIIKIMPPVNSALARYFSPKRLPSHTPKAEAPNVIIPINTMSDRMFILRNAKVTPAVSASILSAIASGNMTFAEKKKHLFLCFDFFLAESFCGYAGSFTWHDFGDTHGQQHRESTISGVWVLCGIDDYTCGCFGSVLLPILSQIFTKISCFFHLCLIVLEKKNLKKNNLL